MDLVNEQKLREAAIRRVAELRGISVEEVKAIVDRPSNPREELVRKQKSFNGVLPVGAKMNKTVIQVPAGVRYISDWSDYSLEKYSYPHILDKKIPGCGFTEYALTCDLPVILASPRKILLQNKRDYHGSRVHYFNNTEEEEVNFSQDLADKRVTGIGPVSIFQQPTEKELMDKEVESAGRTYDLVVKIKSDLKNYVQSCIEDGSKPKILVTYDSFRHVKGVLSELGYLDFFWVVVDEFQSIFTDSRFKSDTELDFSYSLYGMKNVCYVSATPMMDDYLAMTDEFCDLPYLELDWETLEPGRCIRPSLKVRVTNSIVSTGVEIIQDYLKGKFEPGWDSVRNDWVKSTEAVIYVNSVKNILSIIKKAGLSPDQVNILCSRTSENQSKIKKRLGRKFEIGKIPLRGEPHKMITLCTRTVYLGADFMSTCARTFILSDANIDSLSVDISLDLPQILGRQRLECNPFRNHAEFWYRPLGKSKKQSVKDFMDDTMKEKIRLTNSLLSAVNQKNEAQLNIDLTGEFRKSAKFFKYKDHYVAVNSLDPVFNKLVLIAERRAFDIQQIDYADRFTVFNKVQAVGIQVDRASMYIQEVLRNTGVAFSKRLKDLCETDEFTDSEKRIIAIQAGDKFDRYYNGLGPAKCRSVGYNITFMNRIITESLSADSEGLDRDVYDTFQVGSRYSRIQAKEMLQKIYDKYKKVKKAKALDLSTWFELKKVKFVPSGKTTYENGLEILGQRRP